MEHVEYNFVEQVIWHPGKRTLWDRLRMFWYGVSVADWDRVTFEYDCAYIQLITERRSCGRWCATCKEPCPLPSIRGAGLQKCYNCCKPIDMQAVSRIVLPLCKEGIVATFKEQGDIE